MNNKHLFLTFLEAGKFKIKVPADSRSGESPFSCFHMAVFYLHMADREQENSLGSPWKGTTPIYEGSTFLTSYNPNYLPKVPSPNAITLVGRPSTYEFGGWAQTFSL